MSGGNGSSPSTLRELNRRRVIDALRDMGVASRADIARRTGLSRSTVSTLVSRLRADGLVVDHEPAEGDGGSAAAGRPPMLIGLGRQAGAAIGIDFGKRHLAVAVSDLSHIVRAEARREMDEGYGADEGLDTGARLVQEVLDQAGIEASEVLGAGLGLPGPIHRPSGRVGSTAILPGWAGMGVAEAMEDRLETPVHVDNDANLGALAELYWGAGHGAANLVYIKVATGIGAGLVVEGKLFYGAGGTAGELGHVTVDEDGAICRCGSRGCLETMAAGPAIVELIRSSLGHELTVEEVVARAMAGDPGCRRVLQDSGRHIGDAVADVCNLLNPERVVVGGSVGQAGEMLLGEMREAVRRHVIPSAGEDVEIVPGVLGERAEVLGAVALVLGSVEDAAVAAGQ